MYVMLIYQVRSEDYSSLIVIEILSFKELTATVFVLQEILKALTVCGTYSDSDPAHNLFS